MDSYEIGLKQDEKEKELATLLKDLQEVEQAELLMARDILDLQRKRKDLQIAKSKASHNVKQVSIELRLLKSQFWASKNSGA